MKVCHKRSIGAIKAKWNSMMKSDIELLLIGHGFRSDIYTLQKKYDPVEKYKCGPKTLDFIFKEVSKIPGNKIRVPSPGSTHALITIYIKESDTFYYKIVLGYYIRILYKKPD